MKWNAVTLGAMLFCAGAALPDGPPALVFADKPPPCEPGYRYVQETGYREVDHPFCKVVPIKRTKWIYTSRPDYFCIPACPLTGLFHHGDGCCANEPCPACEGPNCRQKLFKKKVEWECGTRCVVEVIKEKVPCPVWRKVPCGPGEVPPAPPPLLVPPPAAPVQAPAVQGR